MRREERIDELQEEFAKHVEEQTSKKRRNYVSVEQNRGKKKEYSQGSSGVTIKTREKPEAIHLPTNATKQHLNYSEQGCNPETSLENVSSALYSVLLSEFRGLRTVQLSTRAQFKG